MHNPQRIFAFVIPVAVLLMLLLLTTCSAVHVVEPGHRGVIVTLGKVAPDPLPEGVNFIMPLVTEVVDVSVRQETEAIQTESYSSDLQQVEVTLQVLFRVPEREVVTLYRDYSGDPFRKLIEPRAVEAFKEVVAEMSAERLVKERQLVKSKSLDRLRQKLGDLIEVNDLVIVNIDLSRELEQAIEQKMVQEQEAQKAKFAQEKAKIEADTALIRARAEAESIKMQGEALRLNPDLIGFRIVEKWNGIAPLVIGGAGGANAANMILPLSIRELNSEERNQIPVPGAAPASKP